MEILVSEISPSQKRLLILNHVNSYTCQVYAREFQHNTDITDFQRLRHINRLSLLCDYVSMYLDGIINRRELVELLEDFGMGEEKEHIVKIILKFIKS